MNDRSRKTHQPGKKKGGNWKEIGLGVKDQLNYDHVQVVSAGIAFYFFLALFPAIAALVSIYGLFTSPGEVQQQMSQLTTQLPQQAHEMISGILQRLAQQPESTLGWSLVISILISLYSAKKGTSALFEGINIAYNERDGRGFIIKNAVQLLFTLGVIVTGIIAIALVAGFPALVGKLGLPSGLQSVISWGRWLLLGLIIMFSIGLIYRVAPDRNTPKSRWVSPGAVIATVLWIVASVLFSWFVNNFGNYDKTYGSFAAVIILILWFYINAYIIILGAEINSVMENPTRKERPTSSSS
ncbi:MAG: YihY/virulence factor BrkB family protein [Bacteroidetes bacterium]|nr:MAG: YihY/virulence factor BrkB family protein [Bacteroidota bacterium]